jgi:Fe-S oxidoreductase
MGRKERELVPPGLTFIADNIVSKNNVLGADKKAKAGWAKDLALPARGDTVFFAGCGYQYESGLESLMSLLRRLDKSTLGAERAMGLAGFQKKLGIDLSGVYRKLAVKDSQADGQPLVAAVKVLQQLGVEFAYLGADEPCCGGLLHYAGLADEFDNQAQKTFQKLQSLGVKRLISVVPSCTYTLRELYANSISGYDLEVKHFIEVVLQSLKPEQYRYPRRVRVAYHDPCQLARYLGLIDEPRRILEAIGNIELVETAYTSGEWATCCGGGGGFEAVFPEISHILAVNRARELVETGAEIVVTHCPGCIMQLKAGLTELVRGDIEVLDLAEVLAQAMGV